MTSRSAHNVRGQATLGHQGRATLSRLNRAHPQKHDCFVLDLNNGEAITFAFQDYYRTTLLAEETDPNKLHDLKAALMGPGVLARAGAGGRGAFPWCARIVTS